MNDAFRNVGGRQCLVGDGVAKPIVGCGKRLFRVRVRVVVVATLSRGQESGARRGPSLIHGVERLPDNAPSLFPRRRDSPIYPNKHDRQSLGGQSRPCRWNARCVRNQARCVREEPLRSRRVALHGESQHQVYRESNGGARQLGQERAWDGGGQLPGRSGRRVVRLYPWQAYLWGGRLSRPCSRSFLVPDFVVIVRDLVRVRLGDGVVAERVGETLNGVIQDAEVSHLRVGRAFGAIVPVALALAGTVAAAAAAAVAAAAAFPAPPSLTHKERRGGAMRQ